MQLSKRNQVVDVSKKILSVLLILSLIIYAFSPVRDEVSMPLFYTCFSLMIFSNYIFFKAKRKGNYLDFDTIFIVIYCLVGFTTTFFYHDIKVFREIFLGFPVDEEYINRGNLVFLIGLQAYMIGSLNFPSKLKSNAPKRVVKTTFLIILIFILITLFFATGGISYYRAEYGHVGSGDDSVIAKYVLLLLVTTAMALVGTEMYNKKVSPSYKISKLAFMALFFLVGTLLFVGNRTGASQILLPILCLFAMFFRKISFKKFIILSIGGIIAMWFVQRLRTTEQSFELSNPIMLILDLTIPVRNTYAAMRYVDVKDYTYGESMIMGVVGIVPFAPSLVKSVFPEIVDGSAELLTQYTFQINRTPDEVQIGLGTTIIADIFLAFGILGVIILMYFLGFYVNKWSMRSLELDYYSIIFLSGMLGNAVFIVRASFVHPLRFVVWAVLLAMINQFLNRTWKK